MGFKIYYFMVSPSRNPPHSCPTSTTMASGRPPSLDHLCNVHGMYCTFASPNSGPQIDMYLNKKAKMVLTGELKTRLKPDQLFACPISPPSKKTRATHAASVGFSSSAPSTARSNLKHFKTPQQLSSPVTPPDNNALKGSMHGQKSYFRQLK